MGREEQSRAVVRYEEEVVGSGLGSNNDSRIRGRLKSQQLEIYKKLQKIRDSSNVLDAYSGAEYLIYHSRLHQLASHPLSELHIPRYHRFDAPYWEVPFERHASRVLHTQISPHLEVWSGRLASFDLGLRALIVDMAMRVYASELLQTKLIAEGEIEQAGTPPTAKSFSQKVDKRKSDLEAQLLLAMSHSFRPDYVLAIAFAMPEGPQGSRHLVGSIGAVPGQTDRLLGETIGMDGKQDDSAAISSLPTNTALTYQLNNDSQQLAQLPENKIVEVTRLNVAPRQVCEQLGVLERGVLSQALMYLIHQAIAENLPDAEWEILLALHRVIKQLGLPARIISQPDSVRPTAVVTESIHGHYFRRSPPTPQMMRVEEALKRSEQYFVRET
ncbi:hypothetical protein H3C66_02320 [Patescibacteria group bacterium]|nr:hypothetical protein [Patescibacteria group bacterium]